MKHILYIASQSTSRKQLLTQMGIPFEVWPQSAHEKSCDWTQSLEKVVTSIAECKMASLDFSSVNDKNIMWVVTADTLGQAVDGITSRRCIYGKPEDYADAVNQLKKQRDQWLDVATAFCLERKKLHNGVWITDAAVTQVVTAKIFFSIPDSAIAEYIRITHALNCAGSITIDGFGGQYLKAINGSYSAVIGLPLYELRCALTELNFF